jgi:hypothetical protein
MIKINICVPFYTYNDVHRYKLTLKIFSYIKSLSVHFKHIASFSFTLVGSEKHISKNLALIFFDESEYFEFDQSSYNNLSTMLTAKIRYGMQMSFMKNADIYLLMGSNDYISYEFFTQIIEYYNNEYPQLYGIDNYYNGQNIVSIPIYDSMQNTFISETKYVWDGISSHCGRDKFKYCGGIIGINRKCISLYDDVLDIFQDDEGIIEERFLSKLHIDKFNSKNVIFMNIKTTSNKEINTHEQLYASLHSNLLDIHKFPQLYERLKSIEYEFLCL